MSTDAIVGDIDVEPAEVDEVAATQRAIVELSELVSHFQAEVVKSSNTNDPEGISTAMLRLARINSALGRHAAFAKYIARNADRAAKRGRAERTLANAADMAVNKAELKAEISSKTDFEIASEAQLVADQADDLCFRTDTFLKMSQSRLSLIKNDAARG